MNRVSIVDGLLLVEPVGLDKVWALKAHMGVPLAHVRSVTFDPDAAGEPKGVRAPGLAMGHKWAGTFMHEGLTSFWNVSGSDGAVVIELDDEEFNRLYLTVEDPAGVIEAISSAIE